MLEGGWDALCLETLDGLGPGADGNPESSGGTLTPTGSRAADRRGGVSWCGIGSRAAGGCDCPARPALYAVTLSDTEGQGERAHCRLMALILIRLARWPPGRRTG